MIGIIDYGVGNLFSLCSSLEAIGESAVVSGDTDILSQADGLILPGVGAFEDAIKKLKGSGLDSFIKEYAKTKPLMGICLGMQLLFEKSYEYGEFEGLCMLKGEVVPMEGSLPKLLKIPHIGWNALHKQVNDCTLLNGISEGECVYFVHSYYATGCDDSLIATTEYGKELTAAVHKGNVYGCQFHPEKSSDTGLKILSNFAKICKA